MALKHSVFLLYTVLIAAHARSRQLTNSVVDGYPGYPLSIYYDPVIGPGTKASMPFNDTVMVKF